MCLRYFRVCTSVRAICIGVIVYDTNRRLEAINRTRRWTITTYDPRSNMFGLEVYRDLTMDRQINTDIEFFEGLAKLTLNHIVRSRPPVTLPFFDRKESLSATGLIVSRRISSGSQI